MKERTIAELAAVVADPTKPMRKRLRAVKRLAAGQYGRAFIALAGAARHARDDAITAATRRVFAECRSQWAIDDVCSHWFFWPEPYLGDLIARNGWIADRPAKVRVRTALHVRQPEALVYGDEAAAAALLSAAADQALAEELRDLALEALKSLYNQVAREVVCSAGINDGNETALSTAIAAGYRPANPARYALLLFLAGEFERYEELDFDGALLRATRRVAEPALLARLAAKARKHGRLDWLRMVTDGRSTELSDEEWDSVGGILVEAGRWDELWSMASEATPIRAAALLQRLTASDLRPEVETDKADLVDLAEECTRYPVSRMLREARRERKVCALAMSADGSTLAASDTTGQIDLWELPSGSPAGSVHMRSKGLYQTSPAPDRLAFTPDGELLIAASSGTKVDYWRLPDLTPVEFPDGGFGSPLAVSPDGRHLMTGDGGNSLAVRQLPSATSKRRLTDDYRGALTMSPDGTLAAGLVGFDTGTGVRVWHLLSGKRVADIRESAYRLAFSPAGNILATGGPIRLWSTPSGDLIGSLDPHETLRLGDTMVFTPDGSLLAASSSGVVARLWRIPSGELAATIEFTGDSEGTGLQVTADLAVTSDGRLLVSTDHRGDVRLWHLPSGDAAGVLHSGAEIVRSTMSPAGGMFAGWGRGGSVWLWMPRIYEAANTPIARLTLADAQSLRALPEPGEAERPWIELIARLVERRHRHDISVDAKATSKPHGDTDIELGE
ncbi:WD40 repeat domain-containing protein [Glycomyces buryatensis]|uniref:WD40 repeat domain-containing protein n=1 Tax=Glycomyces buryatensis TaxID=2570927 RepID=A0A4S8Q1Q0_9ACTN|nr:hypothetical protein [Glycomyces buryatensis]THV36362.1 hypothetical protein FAB82_21445 [Glycomyces buryatensis]